jgi:hypothetical protein
MDMDLSVYGKPAPRRPGQTEPQAPAAAPATRTAELNSQADDILATLRAPLKLELLPNYPHVLNRMAELWAHPRFMTQYFEELLLDSRGGRNGFPLEVIAELTRLRSYYQARVNPVKPTVDVWSTARKR